jgi:thioredoxin reductase (NADPH)
MLKNYLIFGWAALSSLLANPLFSSLSEKEEEHPVVILGGGIGALTSAIYLSRAGINPMVITGPNLGGAITQSHSVQNWPGELEITGLSLSERVKEQALKNEAVLLTENVIDVDFSRRPFVITTQAIGTGNTRKIKTDACIIAMGAMPKFLNVPGEGKYWSRGVYSCAVCDGGLYRDKVVAVVGGGDSALTEAHYLSNIASKVYVLVRGDHFRSIERERMQTILGKSNIEVLYQTEVNEVRGNNTQVTHLIVENNRTHKKQQISVDALFLAIGSKPNTELFVGQLDLDQQGYIVLKQHQETSVSGVYAVGDVADPEFKQAISAAGDGSKAALQAQKYLTRFQPGLIAKTSPLPVANQGVIEIETEAELDRVLCSSEGSVLLDFYGDYCGPCRTFGPQFVSWATEFQGKATFAKVNVQQAQGLCETYQIQAIPTLVVLDREGKVVRKSCGITEIAEVGKRLKSAKDRSKIDAEVFK